MNNLHDPARILIWDLECTDLEASFGHVLCAGYKYLGEKNVTVLGLSGFPKPKSPAEPDANLVRAFGDILTNHADIIVTYYGKEFDRKFLNTRLILAGSPPLPPLNHEHIDLYWTAKGNLKLHSNRLGAVSETLGCPWNKTPVRADVWRRAQRGDAGALAYIHKHCALDVRILEWCYMKLRPFVRQHPHVGLEETCRACGASRWQRRGYTIVKSGKRAQRVQCQSCGRWEERKVAP